MSPANDAGWSTTASSGYMNRKAVTTKIASGLVTVTNADNNNTNRNLVYAQYISDPIAAQTLSAQTLKWQHLASEVSSFGNLFTAICVRVVSNDGTTVTGTCLAVTRDGLEVSTPGAQNRQFSATTSSVSANANDRICIEVGLGGTPTVNGADGSMFFQDDGSDLAESDTGNSGDPWVEFANTITFAGGGGATVRLLSLTGVGT